VAGITFKRVVEWVFYGSLVFMSNRAVATLDKLEASVSTLNEKVAVVIQVTSDHAKQIEKQDERIRILELQKKSN